MGKRGERVKEGESPHSLDQIPFFAGLSRQTLVEASSAAICRVYAAGTEIILEGDPCACAYFIAAGSLRVYRSAPDGRIQVLARLGRGQAFNTVPALQENSLNHASVNALSDSVVYAIPRADFCRLVQTCPDLAYALLKDFASRLSYLTDLVEDLSLHSVRARLARFLIEQADRGENISHWTQDEMAEQLGTVRDVVGRTLRAFVDAGLLRRERHRLILVDRGGLEKEAKYG